MNKISHSFGYNINHAAYQASQSYFQGYSELCSSKTTVGEKFVAVLKVISMATLIVPLFFGASYVVSKGLRGRATQIQIHNAKTQKRQTSPLEKAKNSAIPTKLTDLAKRTDHVGAGVIPYFIDNEGTAYLLLSKEAAGPSKNLWCDFGGKADPNENTITTAAREGWEESRDLLGPKEEIKKSIAANNPIGMEAPRAKYAMFFMEVENPNNVTNETFQAKKFDKWSRMEKSDIAWVKASDVFKAVIAGRARKDKTIQINGNSEKLRGCFASTLWHALKNKSLTEERALLISLLGEQNLA